MHLPAGPARSPALRRVDPDLFPPSQWRAAHRGDHRNKTLRVLDLVAGAAAELLALAVPVDCVCCGAEDSALCLSCARRIRWMTRSPFRAEAGAPALMDVDGDVLLPVVAAGVYREELSQALLSYKKHGQHRLKQSLGTALAGAVLAATEGAEGICLVPVPTSTAAYVDRGFSPVHLLLQEAARTLPAHPVQDVLTKSGTGVFQLPGGQKGLGRGARASRVRGSMRVRKHARSTTAGCRCIIVDDVLTTGATLAEAARALHRAGASVGGAVVLAATRPPAAAGSAAGPAGYRQVADDLEKNKPGKDE